MLCQGERPPDVGAGKVEALSDYVCATAAEDADEDKMITLTLSGQHRHNAVSVCAVCESVCDRPG